MTLKHEEIKNLMLRLIEYHKSLGFNGFDLNCPPPRFIRWYLKKGKTRNWLKESIRANTIEELEIKLSLRGY